MNIENSLNNFLEMISDSNYSTATIRNYKDKIKSLKTFCNNYNIEFFGDDSINLYIETINKRLENKEICKQYASMLCGTAWSFYYFVHSDSGISKIVNRRTMTSSKNTLNEFSKIIFEEYSEYLNRNYLKSSKRRYELIVSVFLHYLEDSKIALPEITSTTVRDYIVYVSPANPRSLDSAIGGLKVFLYYLYDNKYFDWPVRLMSFHVASSHKKIPVAYSKDEIQNLLNVMDRDTAIGKRDYAAIILSLYTGLRSVDVRHIKLDNINWNKDEIDIIQHKTNREIKIPMLPIVGNAMIDYLLNGRPTSDERYIFLSHNKKDFGKMMGSHVLICRIRYYLSKTNIKVKGNDGKDFHALRKTFATNLLLSGTPLEEISNALGDAGVQAAKPYLSLNDEMIRECCVKLMKFPCTKEGLNA